LSFKSFFLVAVGLVSIIACSPEEVNREPVARVHETFLYRDEVEERIPNNLTVEDSLALAKSITYSWIERQLLVHQAEKNLDAEIKDVEKKLQEYRNDLLIYAYQNELIQQKLDTTISETEIEEYYQSNQDHFKLKDYIVKVQYVRLDTNAPKVDEVKTWMRKDDEESKTQLEEYCYQFASNFYLDDQNWLYLDDVLKEVPVEIYNKANFVRSRQLIEHQDSTNVYLLKISSYQLKDGVSPLSLERDKIKSMLLNKRRSDFLNQLKEDLRNEAISKNNFETFDNQ
jgi:hypothetical protein